MFAKLGAILFGMIALLSLLVTLGFPLGEFTLGGQFTVLPMKFRIISGVSLIIQIFAITVILQAGEVIAFKYSSKLVQIASFIFACYLTLNTVMNYLSESSMEKLIMTPLALCAGICFWITFFQFRRRMKNNGDRNGL